jgi:hypothetical protein
MLVGRAKGVGEGGVGEGERKSRRERVDEGKGRRGRE